MISGSGSGSGSGAGFAAAFFFGAIFFGAGFVLRELLWRGVISQPRMKPSEPSNSSSISARLRHPFTFEAPRSLWLSMAVMRPSVPVDRFTTGAIKISACAVVSPNEIRSVA